MLLGLVNDGSQLCLHMHGDCGFFQLSWHTKDKSNDDSGEAEVCMTNKNSTMKAPMALYNFWVEMATREGEKLKMRDQQPVIPMAISK